MCLLLQEQPTLSNMFSILVVEPNDNLSLMYSAHSSNLSSKKLNSEHILEHFYPSLTSELYIELTLSNDSNPLSTNTYPINTRSKTSSLKPELFHIVILPEHSYYAEAKWVVEWE